MSSDFLGGHCCAQMKAVPGEDRLALEKEWYFLYLFPPDLCRSLTSSYRQSDFVRSKVIQVKIRSQSQTCRMWPGANLVELVDSGTVANPIQFANEWTRYANLTFKWMERDALGDSDIRISFDRDGYWSALGTKTRAIWNSVPPCAMSLATLSGSFMNRHLQLPTFNGTNRWFMSIIKGFMAGAKPPLTSTSF